MLDISFHFHFDVFPFAEFNTFQIIMRLFLFLHENMISISFRAHNYVHNMKSSHFHCTSFFFSIFHKAFGDILNAIVSVSLCSTSKRFQQLDNNYFRNHFGMTLLIHVMCYLCFKYQIIIGIDFESASWFLFARKGGRYLLKSPQFPCKYYSKTDILHDFTFY